MHKCVSHDIKTAVFHYKDLQPVVDKYGKKKSKPWRDVEFETEKVHLILMVALLSQFTTMGPPKTWWA